MNAYDVAVVVGSNSRQSIIDDPPTVTSNPNIQSRQVDRPLLRGVHFPGTC